VRERRSEGMVCPSPQDPTACLGRVLTPTSFPLRCEQRLYLEVGGAPGLLVNVPPMSKPPWDMRPRHGSGRRP
jgi:hypothetical protein